MPRLIELLGEIVDVRDSRTIILDMYFYEDLCRVSKDMALENTALLRKLVLNIIKRDTRYDKYNKNGNPIKLSFKKKD